MIVKSGTGPQIAVEAINDKRLSDGAIATLAFLMSKPENWKVYCTSIASRYQRNRRTAQKYLDELIAAGYAQRNEKVRKDGKTSYTYDVSDKPNNIYSVHPVHTSNITNPAIISNAEVKQCITDLQLTLDMYKLSADQPIDSKTIKAQVKQIIAAGITPKVFCMYVVDYFHGKHGTADIQVFIEDAVQVLTYKPEPQEIGTYNGCNIECD